MGPKEDPRMHLTIHEENETRGIAVSTHNVRDAGANVSEKCGEESSTYPSSWNLCYAVVLYFINLITTLILHNGPFLFDLSHI